MQEFKTVIFYGISGAGKGTQAELLAKYLELEAPEQHPSLYIETGQLFRGFVKGEGYSNELTKARVEEGGLLPAFLPIYIWSTTFVEEFNGTQHLILDGLARRIEEVPVLDSALSFYGREDYQIISLEISDETAIERLKNRGRSDDYIDEQAIARKIAWYHKDVQPCIAKFKEMGKTVLRVDGGQSIEDIHKEILAKLGLVS